MSEQRSVSGAGEERVNVAVKRMERWQLLRAALPLVCLSASIPVLYAVLALTSDLDEPLYGVPLLLGGLLCAVLGYRRRLRELRAPGEPTTHGYGLLFLGWALTAVGAVLPWYLLA